MHLFHTLSSHLPEVEEKIGYIFRNKDLLIQALVHRSFVNEHKDLKQAHNERLEFLGDSVLGLLTSDFLYHRFPQEREGALSQLRSRLVDAHACAHYLQKLDLAGFLILGRGETMTEGKTKISILSDAFEALIGALYLDGGLDAVRAFMLKQFHGDIEDTLGAPSSNFKADFQIYAQKKWQKAPVYRVIQEEGPDHAKHFLVAVFVDMQEVGQGSGESKKQAEQQAAKNALEKFKSEAP
jgi:ribonuclease-3